LEWRRHSGARPGSDRESPGAYPAIQTTPITASSRRRSMACLSAACTFPTATQRPARISITHFVGSRA
jgi:hypothetical protein